MKTLTLALGLMLMSTAFAGGADGTRGGETTPDIDGIPRLRDLVEKTNCEWTDGEALIQKNPLVNDVLNRISYVDWYFASELKKEIQKLDYCQTGKLVKVDTSDQESLVTMYKDRTTQVAIRFKHYVYIDMDHMARMPKHDQAFLLIHEAVHSYMDENVTMRNQKLRSMVKAMESVYLGNMVSTKSFHQQLRNNSIDFPTTVENLNPRKEEVQFLVGDYATRRAGILKALSIRTFFNRLMTIQPGHLAKWHQDLLLKSPFRVFLDQVIQQEDVEVLRKLLKDSDDIREITMETLLTSSFANNSDVLRVFMTGGELQDYLGLVLKALAEMHPQLNDEGRIIAPGIELLTATTDVNLELTTHDAHDFGSFEKAHPRTKLFLRFLASLIAKKRNAELEQHIFNNDMFYQAFSNQVLKAEIKTLDVKYAQERDLALRKVDTVMTGFWTMAKRFITEQSNASKWNAFVKKIDQTKLGYKI